MLRNRGRVSKRKNHRNVRKKNQPNTDTSTDCTSSSSDSDSSHNDSLFDDTSVSSFEEECTSPVVGRKLRTRRKQLNSKSKPSNKENGSRNRNPRSSNVTNTRKTQNRNDSNVAGPSRVNNNSRRARQANSSNRTAKRKYKDRRDESRSSESEPGNTSSEESPEDMIFPIRKKRFRQINLNSSESDDSVIQPISTRRPTLLDSESSTSASDEIRITNRSRASNQAIFSSWSESTSNSIESNSTRESSSSPHRTESISDREIVRVFLPMSYSSSSSSASPMSASLFSFNPEAMNLTSVQESEASSYNTAHSNNTVKDQSSDSDSSDSDGDKCAICLKKFRTQLIGSPSNCDHYFCAPCIKKWSESSTTCPVDRSTFDSIAIRSEINGPIIDRVRVENRNFGIFPPLDMDEVLLNDIINCEICGSGEDEETLLLCDLCNLGFHMACLHPPLPAIPAGSWFCPQCTAFRSNPTMNMSEAVRLLDFPMRPVLLFSSNRRPTRAQAGAAASRSTGRLRMGRGPRRNVQNSSNSGLQDLSNVIESFVASINAMTPATSRRKKKRRNRNRNNRGNANRAQQSTAAESSEALVDPQERITKKINKRAASVLGPRAIPRPSGPNELVDLVFPSFSLFGDGGLDYFSDEQGEDDMEGEVAIMARVRNEYSARRVENRKNIVSSLTTNYRDRINSTVEDLPAESNSSANLLDSILESQTLWHSKNVEIKSKKDGTLEIKMKDENNKKPDLTNTNHTSKEIPLYPNKSDGASENKSYSNSNNRYSSLASGSTGGGNSFTPSTSAFNSLNPSTRPGFSNLLGNSSSALDLSPFRGSAPIRFRMNPPRPAMRRQNYNPNTQRQSSSSANLANSVQSPKKASAMSNTDDDVDLYDDIDTENAESEKSQEIFTSLEPPPEPPALLIGTDSSSDEDNGLVIDDKAVNNSSKSNIYDPTEPNEDSDNESTQDKDSNIVPGYLRSPSYGGFSEFGPHLPLPEPPALPMELDSVKDSDEEEETECPNMTLYSSTSINLANNVQDIPIPDAAYPQDDLDCIPIPTLSPGDDEAVEEPITKDSTVTKTDAKLYSPTDKHDSESEIEEITSYRNSPSPPPRNGDLSDSRSVSSRCSSQVRGSYTDESDRSEYYERVKKRKSRKKKRKEKPSVAYGPKTYDEVIDVEKLSNEKPLKEIDLTEADDSNDDKVDNARSDTEDVAVDEPKINDETPSPPPQSDNKKSGDESDEDEDEKDVEAGTPKSANDKTETEDEIGDRIVEKVAVEETEIDESDKEEVPVEASADPDNVDAIPDNDSPKANSVDANVSNSCLLPSEDLDPVSDVEYNDFPDYQRSSSVRDKRKKRKKTRRRDSSPDKAAEAKELEEGEIEDEKSRRKYATQKRRARSETPDRKEKKRRDRKDKSAGKENKESSSKGNDESQWKKIPKTTKERNYRDGKAKPSDKLSDKNREREQKSRKEKRKEIERYDVRKIVSDKPRTMRDEFGRDVSANRSRSRTRSRSASYGGRRRSKGTLRRSLSQDDRWIDWSPVWNQRRSRSRTRRTRSRSRNRSRLSNDRYRNRSKNRDREYDKRESRKRKRSLSVEIEKYTPPAELKKRRRSRDRSRKSESYAPIRPSAREVPDYYYERSWSRSISYASLTPEPEQYVRYSRSPSIIEAPARIPLLTPDHEHDMMTPNPQNLTVIVPNVDAGKKKHKKKKESKKKKKKQPSKEVFTSGDNIVVSVNFDDNQKIISAKSSKRKHDEEKGRKKKKDESRKKRKQTLQVSDEVLNAKPVAVIDLNTSPCKEMSPTEVISLTDSGDEANTNENCNKPADRRIVPEDANKSPERRAYVMTQSGPKTPPEPPIKFTVNSTAPMRPLPTNPIFEQDEMDREENSVHYNKGPNTPPEPANQTRRSVSPNATMYDPFEPTKSRSQSPENAQIYEERKDNATSEERRPVIDMFSEDNDKTNENQNGDKTKSQDDAKGNVTPKSNATVEESQTMVKSSPAKETASGGDSVNEATQSNGGNTSVVDLSGIEDDYIPKSSIPSVKSNQSKYDFQTGKAPDKPTTVAISPQSQPVKPQPQQVMVTPTRQIPTKPVEPMKQAAFPDVMSWKPPPMSQSNFSTPPPTISSSTANLVTPSKSAPGMLTQNGGQDESTFEFDDSPYSPASSEGDDLFEPPPLNASSSPNKQRPSPLPAVNSYKSRVDALFGSSPIKKMPPRSNLPPHISKPMSAIKGTKKVIKPAPMSSKKDVGIRADEEQLKILDDVPNSAVEMIVKEKFLKKLHRQERVVEEVKVVLKPHYAKKHITKEEYKDILRKAVPKICHNKTGDINPSKIQGLVEAYVKKIRYSKKKPMMGAGAPLFPPVKTGKMKQQKSMWG